MVRALACLLVATCGLVSVTADSMSVLSAPKSLKVKDQSKALDVTDVADILSQSMGMPSLSHKTQAQASVNPLSLPSASVVFTVDGLEDSPTDMPKKVSYAEIAQTQNMDSIATIVSMLTGRYPSEHLIPGRMWVGKEGVEHGLITPSTRALAGNLADAMAQMFDHSVTVSVSGDEQFAHAAAANFEVNEARPSQSFVYTLGDKNGFSHAEGSDELADVKLSKKAIAKALPEFKGKYIAADDKTFNLDNKVDFRFFAELYAIQQVLVSAMRVSGIKAVASHPDFFSFALSSLPEVRAKYGPNSPQYTEAKRVYLQFIEDMVSLIEQHYTHSAVVSMLTLSQRADVPVSARRPFYNPIKRNRRQEDDPKYPSSYADCLVEGADYDTDYCQYGPNHAVFFNIFFWLSVFLIAMVWMTIWAQATMPIQDSVIFRMTGSLRPKME
ncbi:hypothetical protein SARC_09432 [Sphaeroforma arctica JP610]|uniref:Uncharacterized protein n=1 Tax=Sphaeroforma arctica JP610 TaxID=667725 RepID=A0A0L0FMY1_9EUKA|nr:hypothetical protein SARC_09432 [Sphaeroforma arctica JP610]KNC78125.1 hypothetical protein SARC_09432 [Sphaeroforma arctica JP610]|eukprot:XP_014152027.1 hypothetical protein SARC_09432 [Sphaeroforma arctica JP610]